MVNLLLEAKADPEIRNNRGESYLDALNLGNKQLLLMEAILQHLGCINLVNNGISYLSTGAGFQPSTVVSRVEVENCWSTCDFCKSSRRMEVFVGQLGHCCGMMGLVGEIYRVCFLFAKLRHIFDISHTIKYPIPSMYGIFTYIWFTFMLNVGRYTTHGSYRYIADL